MKKYLILLLMFLTRYGFGQEIDSVKIETSEHLWRFSQNHSTGDSTVTYCDILQEILLLKCSKNKKKLQSSSYKSLKYKLIPLSEGYSASDSILSEINYKQNVSKDSIMKLLNLFDDANNHTIEFTLELEPHRRKTIIITIFTQIGILIYSKMISSNGHSLWNSGADNFFYIKNIAIENTIQNFVPSKFIQYKIN